MDQASPKVETDRNRGGRPKGYPKSGGRKAGTPNRYKPEELRADVAEAFYAAGGVAYLTKIAETHPAVFCSLFGRIIPPPEPAPSNGLTNVLVLRWVTPEIAQARGMIELTANSKEPGQD